MKKQWGIRIILALAALGLSVFLLKGDSLSFLTWWMLMLLLGVAFMPVTGTLFCGFADRGWIFSKVLGVAVSGYLLWALCVGGVLPFTGAAGIGILVFCMAANLVFAWYRGRKGQEYLPEGQASLIFWEELVFFLVFLMWTYFAGFRPEAYGTEKFMDYGFMEAMMRSTQLPATDMWYSQAPMNYYYGGQYFATFLTKVTFTRVEETYHLMRTLVAAFSFSLPCSLVYQLLTDRRKGYEKLKKAVPVMGGLLAGGAVSLAGNMHYIVYSKVIPLLQKWGILEGEPKSYWFPDATRYIGHNPEVGDKTIHEFPCYSFVLGDLHAHVVNLMFVIFVIGLLYAWLKRVRRQGSVTYKDGKAYARGELLQPEILLIGAFLGMFQWTNFWDFVIYYVVTGGVVLFANIVRHGHKVGKVIGTTALQAVEVMAVGALTALPFTLTFDSMVQGVALCQNHSRFYQLLVLWGLPFLVVLTFLLVLFHGKWRQKIGNIFDKMIPADMFILVLSLCAMGLVLIPEIVYVRDIYENGSARANTMFKLTYQAYVMFGIAMGYILFYLLTVCVKKAVHVWGVILLAALLSTFGYLGNAVHSWFGEVWKPSEYQGLDATAFLETDFWEDAGGIRWLKDNVTGSPVVLEANGDSYSDYERVSAMTGLPTVLGWYVHEWLWRGDVPDINEKGTDIATIYTSTDIAQVQRLLEEYDISYIFVGKMEREKYENLQKQTLRSYGEVVYEDAGTGTFIVKVADME
ncbi:MAG: DUF2298 domain-containing protein [Blautia sp.]|jgi:uncharacterized membrane protein